ncbi:MAG: putative zinc-binding metallopeptidase, partial [Puniceicoccales bacterium]
MKIFQCDSCGQLLFFENTVCGSCGSPLGYLWRTNQLSALVEKNGAYEALASPEASYRYCANQQHGACNWLVPANSEDPYCKACDLNNTIPDLSKDEHKKAWQQLESAKHRLVYSLLRFGLPVESKSDEPDRGL